VNEKDDNTSEMKLFTFTCPLSPSGQSTLQIPSGLCF
jgi:hypothetical protein